MYGDVVAYRSFFPNDSNDDINNKVKSYQERKEELKKSMLRSHSGKNDSRNRPISMKSCYQVTIGIKCYESKKYKLKINKSFTPDVDRTVEYDELHQLSRNHFKIPDNIETFLSSYHGKSLETNFGNIESYALHQKQKKKALHVYLYYPRPYSHLLFSNLKSDVPYSDSEDELTLPNYVCQICPSCSCTYDGINCLMCEQDNAFNLSLQTDRRKAANLQPSFCAPSANSQDNFYSSTTTESESNDNTNANASIYEINKKDISENESSNIDTCENMSNAAVRAARVKHFSRRKKQPVRYRHSVGSPSLSFSSISVDPPEENYFGNDEVDRFFEEINVSEHCDQEKEECADLSNLLEQARLNYSVKYKTDKHIIIQRNKTKFWNVLLRQKFNPAVQDLKIRFAGEAGAGVGLLREFLTICMQNIANAPNLFFGESTKLFFKATPESIMNKTYFLIGQLAALAIIKVGRGPECFHKMLVQSLYEVSLDKELPKINDYELSEKLEKIENNDFDELFDYNINPSNGIEEAKRLFVISHLILNRYSAVEQFRAGMESIDDTLITARNYDVMKIFFLHHTDPLDIEKFLELLQYNKTSEAGSNNFHQEESAIVEFELFIASVYNGSVYNEDVKLKLEDILYFITCFDQVPPHGLPKKIDVFFDGELCLPKVSTCGLSITLPLTNIDAVFKTAIIFGCGFGVP